MSKFRDLAESLVTNSMLESPSFNTVLSRHGYKSRRADNTTPSPSEKVFTYNHPSGHKAVWHYYDGANSAKEHVVHSGPDSREREFTNPSSLHEFLANLHSK